jgi:hypothetical protein
MSSRCAFGTRPPRRTFHLLRPNPNAKGVGGWLCGGYSIGVSRRGLLLVEREGRRSQSVI